LGANGGLAAVDVPEEFLIAGVESVGSAHRGTPFFTRPCPLLATNYLRNDPLMGACEGDPENCWALAELEFFAPYDFNPRAAGNSPIL
jgi:hypothetical protein